MYVCQCDIAWRDESVVEPKWSFSNLFKLAKYCNVIFLSFFKVWILTIYDVFESAHGTS